jgi:hypothetical protein
MSLEERVILRKLLSEAHVLSLGLLVDGKPHVGMLPFIVAEDYRSALVHASQLARHSRGLQPGSPFSALIRAEVDTEGDPLQVPRVTISGTVQHVAQSDAGYDSSRTAFIERFPSSELTFYLGDFNLYRLHFERGRLVSGFARAVTLSPESFAELAEL